MQLAFRIPIFALGLNQLKLQRANCMHCSIPFYMRDLNINGFGYLWGVLEPISSTLDTRDDWGVKIYTLMFDCMRVSATLF